MSVLNNDQIAQIVEREREAAKEGMLIGLLAAALSGAASMLAILWIIGRIWP
jgi:cell division protein FtsX